MEYTHPDLKTNYVSKFFFSFFLPLLYYFSIQVSTLGWSLDGTNDPLPVTISESHGTSCAGEIGMQKSNGYCGAGVAYNAGIAGLYSSCGCIDICMPNLELSSNGEL